MDCYIKDVPLKLFQVYMAVVYLGLQANSIYKKVCNAQIWVNLEGYG